MNLNNLLDISAFSPRLFQSPSTSLGSRQMERYELNGLKIHTDNLNNNLAEREGQIENLNQAVAESHYQLIDLCNSKSLLITAQFRAFSCH